jgi:hypothetical protein
LAGAQRHGLPARPSSPRAVIETLYKVHKQGNGHVFDREGVDRLDRYFDPKLTRLLRKEILGTKPGEVGNLDFDPLFNAQDLDLADFRVGTPRVSGDAATIIVSFRNNNQPVKITYKMRRTARGWRISNLDYGKGYNLVKILGMPG